MTRMKWWGLECLGFLAIYVSVSPLSGKRIFYALMSAALTCIFYHKRLTSRR